MGFDNSFITKTTSNTKQYSLSNGDSGFQLRHPQASDGPAVSSLIERCPPLDTNSRYCNLLQCSHFSETCVLAEDEHGALGFLSGYRPPKQPDVLFLWQLAVDSRARGKGLATKLIQYLLERPELADVRFIETTITPGNEASQGVFKKVAANLKADLKTEIVFAKTEHFDGVHDDEELFRIGPFQVQHAQNGQKEINPSLELNS